MTRRFVPGFVRSPAVGTALALLALLPMLSACTKAVEQTVPGNLAPMHRAQGHAIVGAATQDGTNYEFVKPGANVVGQELIGTTKSDRQVVRIPLDQLTHVVIEQRQADGVKTAFLVTGLLAAGIVIIAAIAAASEPDPQPQTVESCPLIYAWDGDEFVLDAEPYGGATTKGLERDDYSVIEHLVPSDGLYRLRAVNELVETQYMNSFELLAVDHAPGVRVVPDLEGRLYTVQDREEPLAARDAGGTDLLPWLARTDFSVWEPLPVVDESGSMRRHVVLEFRKPAGAVRAELVAHVSTGQWGSHMIRKLLDIRGESLESWYRWVDDDPMARALVYAWNLREELFELKVWVEEPTGWELRGLLPGGGPIVAEDRVVPLDVSRVTGDRLRIRLDPPAGFWAFNSFAVDWTPDEPLSVTRLSPIEAIDGEGKDVLPLLSAADDAYQVMPRTGDQVSLAFAASEPEAGMERTLVLHSRGYYRLRDVGTGPEDPTLVRAIEMEPGAVHRLSARLFAEWTGRVAAAPQEAGAGDR